MLAECGLCHEPELCRGGYGAVAINRNKGTIPFKIRHKFFYTSHYFILLEL